MVTKLEEGLAHVASASIGVVLARTVLIPALVSGFMESLLGSPNPLWSAQAVRRRELSTMPDEKERIDE